MRVHGFPELSSPIEGMKRDSLVKHVRAVLQAVVPKSHEKVVKLNDYYNFILVANLLNPHPLELQEFRVQICPK